MMVNVWRLWHSFASETWPFLVYHCTGSFWHIKSPARFMEREIEITQSISGENFLLDNSQQLTLTLITLDFESKKNFKSRRTDGLGPRERGKPGRDIKHQYSREVRNMSSPPVCILAYDQFSNCCRICDILNFNIPRTYGSKRGSTSPNATFCPLDKKRAFLCQFHSSS